MTTAARSAHPATNELIGRLEAVAGLRTRRGEPLAGKTTLRVGGPAEIFAEVENEAALAALLAAVGTAAAPFHLLGMGSNVLFPDEGLPGVVARLGGDFKRVEIEGTRVGAGAAFPLPRLARLTARRGLAGLEAFAGFPSSVGGAVRMNAGCYGSEIRDVLVTADLVEPDGRRRSITVAELGAGYRTTALQGTGSIVTRAVFQLAPGNAEASLARIQELDEKRWASLPSDHPNAGSIFRNPQGDYAGRLIEVCGLKGESRGAARISPRHANVIVNTGGARAADVLALMLLARRAVAKRFGVVLRPEIVLTGSLAQRWDEEATALPADPPTAAGRGCAPRSPAPSERWPRRGGPPRGR